MSRTVIKDFSIRLAKEKDVDILLHFIKELAEYEKLLHSVTVTEELLKKNLFDKRIAEALIAEYRSEPVGFALFFHNFSTFLGKPGIYLEDIFIRPQFRNMGFGKEIFRFLSQLAVERDCGRMEWSVLDWNTSSIEFYKKLGASMLNEWKIFRLSGEALRKVAK